MGKILDKHWPFKKQKWYRIGSFFFSEEARVQMEKNDKAMSVIEYEYFNKKQNGKK